MREISLNEVAVADSFEVTSGRFLPLLLLMFVGSGCSALIYEIVWFQLLELVIGSSTVSLGILLGTFMGGMCLGSLLFPRFVSRTHHLMRVHDISTTTFVAVALNVVVSLIALGAAKSTSYVAPSNEAEATVARSAWPIYLSIALSGLTALACEVIWTRILSLLFGATVYTFSLVLPVFLLRLGIG